MNERVEGYQLPEAKPTVKGTELTREEAKRQNIIEHLKDTPLETPRFQACADSIDLTYESLRANPNNIKLVVIEETIRQRKNGIAGYKKDDYWNAMEETLRNTTDIPKAIYKNMVRSFPIRFAHNLQEIKDQEIDKRNPPR
jgi:hypothetical protein